jgi:PAS domain S-box-containing protein
VSILTGYWGLDLSLGGVTQGEDSRFKALIQSLFDAYYDWDVESGREEFSDEMDVLLGLSPGGLPRTFAAWAARVHPEDGQRVLAGVDRLIREGGTFTDEYRLRREDGSYVLVLDRGVVLHDAAGRAVHMIGVIRDVTQQREAERAVHESAELLRRQATALEESNTALRVLVDQRTRDRDELARAITGNIEQMVLPMLARLQRTLAGSPEIVYVDATIQTLRDITDPVAQSFDDDREAGAAPLTPREREIANLIRIGKTSDEIAAALYISPATVAFHRKNLRKKLGLGVRGPRLVTHLGRLRNSSQRT